MEGKTICGITGIYSANPGIQEQRLFRHLLYINVLRGMDSTGVIRLEKDNTARWHKAVVDSIEYLSEQKYNKFITQSIPYGYIGHTRAATKGSITLDNAHPFQFKNVLGVHNGTVDKDFDHVKDYGTDSEAIYRNINDHGLKETLEKVHGHRSAYVLNYFDVNNKTINWVKNSQRPLYFTFIFNRKTLVWSSQKEHIQKLLDHYDIESSGLKATDKGTNAFFTLKPHNHMSLILGEEPESYLVTDTGVPETPPFSTGYHSSSTGYSGGSYSSYGQHDDYKHWWENETGNSVSSRGKGNKYKKTPEGYYVPSTLYDDNPFKGGKPPKPKEASFDYGPPRSEKELHYKLSNGCCSCGVVIEPEDTQGIDNLVWYNREYYLCGECSASVMFSSILDPNFASGS